ncbi:MAG: ABC transporter permease [Thermomicrobiales bacterium]
MTVVLSSVLWQLRRSSIGLLSLLIGIAVFELIQPIALRSFGDLDRLAPLLSIVPPSFWALMNVTPDFLTTVGLAGYLSLGFTHPAYLILSTTTVVWFVARSLAGEMERGTIQFTLCRPVSRSRLYLSRVAGFVVVSILVASIGPIGMLLGLGIAPPAKAFPYRHFLATGMSSWLLVWAIGGLTLLFSARANSMGQAIGWALGAFIVSYVIDYFAALWAFLQPIDPFSVFHYYDPSQALARGSLPLLNIVVLGLVGLIAIVAGGAVFSRRDLPV